MRPVGQDCHKNDSSVLQQIRSHADGQQVKSKTLLFMRAILTLKRGVFTKASNKKPAMQNRAGALNKRTVSRNRLRDKSGYGLLKGGSIKKKMPTF